MEEVSILSDPTGITTSSRIDHMAFLRDAIGLDPVSAGMFYQAERLQEKGQLRQAVKYYERVLRNYPNCIEATTNVTIIRELLVDEDEREQEKESNKEREKEPTSSTTNNSSIVTEMDISWHGYEDMIFGSPPDPSYCAYDAAKKHMKSNGYGGSLLKLLENTIHDYTDDDEFITCDGAKKMTGLARFQVTLIPDKEK